MACLASGCAEAYVWGSPWEALVEARAYLRVVERGSAT